MDHHHRACPLAVGMLTAAYPSAVFATSCSKPRSSWSKGLGSSNSRELGSAPSTFISTTTQWPGSSHSYWTNITEIISTNPSSADSPDSSSDHRDCGDDSLSLLWGLYLIIETVLDDANLLAHSFGKKKWLFHVHSGMTFEGT